MRVTVTVMRVTTDRVITEHDSQGYFPVYLISMTNTGKSKDVHKQSLITAAPSSCLGQSLPETIRSESR